MRGCCRTGVPNGRLRPRPREGDNQGRNPIEVVSLEVRSDDIRQLHMCTLKCYPGLSTACPCRCTHAATLSKARRNISRHDPRATGTAITDHARRRSALKASAQSTSADRASAAAARRAVCAQRWPAPRSVDVGLRDLTQARRTRGPACRRGRRGLDGGLGHRLGLRQGLDRGRQGLDHPAHHLAVSDSAR